MTLFRCSPTVWVLVAYQAALLVTLTILLYTLHFPCVLETFISYRYEALARERGSLHQSLSDVNNSFSGPWKAITQLADYPIQVSSDVHAQSERANSDMATPECHLLPIP